jgi:flagellar hook-length control protein FliK
VAQDQPQPQALPGTERALDARELAPVQSQAAPVQGTFETNQARKDAPALTAAALPADRPVQVPGQSAAVAAGQAQAARDGVTAAKAEFPGERVQAASLKARKEWSGELKELAPENAQPAPAFGGDIHRLADGVVREYMLRESVLKQVSDQIESAAREATQLHIKLKPAALGNLDVTLKSEGGKLAAKIFAGSLEVRDVILNNLAQFKQTLEKQGIFVQELTVAVRAEVSQGFDQSGQNGSSWQDFAGKAGQAEGGQAPAFQPDFNGGTDWVSTSSQLSVLA